jgi:alpha-glucosidase (family GH31 glycosyl hydrolase)
MTEPSSFCDGEYPINCRTVVGPPWSEPTAPPAPAQAPAPQQATTALGRAHRFLRAGADRLSDRRRQRLQQRRQTQQRAEREAATASAAGASDPYRVPPPPYVPGGVPLGSGTADLSAQQRWSTHYDVHNLFGHMTQMTTRQALEALTQKRAFVLVRSTFLGSVCTALHCTALHHPAHRIDEHTRSHTRSQ